MIEQYTRQAKNSGWNLREARELVISGYAGWIRKRRRRRENGEDLYRSAAASLPARVKSKLTGKETWFKQKKRRIQDEFDQGGEKRMNKKRKMTKESEEKEERVVGVMFVPYTVEGELARRLREAEKELGKQTGVRLKIVERSGNSLVDLLHQADPWQGQD